MIENLRAFAIAGGVLMAMAAAVPEPGSQPL